MKILIITLSLSLLLISGCSSTKSSGVQPIGKNTFTVTSSTTCTMEVYGAENSSKAREKALTEANNFCSQKGAYINVISERINRGECASVILDFSCEK